MKRIALALILGTVPAAAWAQQGSQCGPRAVVTAHLAEKFGESRHSMGLAGNNTMMEVYASEKSGTWTITVTLPTGITCLVASGEGFETLTEALPAKGDQA